MIAFRRRTAMGAASAAIALAATLGAAVAADATEIRTESQTLTAAPGDAFGAGLDVAGDAAVVSTEDLADKNTHVFTRTSPASAWSTGPKISLDGGALVSAQPVAATDGTRVFYDVVTSIEPMFFQAELRVTPIDAPSTYTTIDTLAREPDSLAVAGGVLVAGFVSGTGAGTVRIYQLQTGVWTKKHTFTDSAADQLGFAVATDGLRVAAGAPEEGTNGAVRIYAKNSFGWYQQQDYAYSVILQSDAGFGSAVAIDAGCLFVGVPKQNFGIMPSIVDAGNVAVLGFDSRLPGFSLRTTVHPATAQEDAEFGASLDFEGNTLVAGAPQELGPLGLVQGAAHVFHRTGGDCAAGVHWSEAFLLRSEQETMPPFTNGALGTRVALTEGGALVSDPTAPLASDSGEVYYYPGVTVLFRDDFESTDTSRWSAASGAI